MPKIIPFNGVRYKKRNLSALVCPPYDVISLKDKKQLLKKSRYNAVRIELPVTHKDARKQFDAWIKKGVLVRDNEPSFYLYRQEYDYKGRKVKRTGFFALAKTEKLGKTIFPHEKTHTAPKIDRFNLLKTTKINTSPVFFLFTDKKFVFKKIMDKITAGKPDAFANLKEVKEKVWLIKDTASINALKKLIDDNKLLIADGHHRYETFFNYTKGGYIMNFLCPFEDKGLLILPTHRVIESADGSDYAAVQKYFSVKKAKLPETIKAKTIGLYYKKNTYLLKPKNLKAGESEYEYLKRTSLKDKTTKYSKDAEDAIKMAGEKGMAFIMPSMTIKQLKDVIARKKILPQKSTYFYPKVSTGIVFNELG